MKTKITFIIVTIACVGLAVAFINLSQELKPLYGKCNLNLINGSYETIYMPLGSVCSSIINETDIPFGFYSDNVYSCFRDGNCSILVTPNNDSYMCRIECGLKELEKNSTFEQLKSQCCNYFGIVNLSK